MIFKNHIHISTMMRRRFPFSGIIFIIAEFIILLLCNDVFAQHPNRESISSLLQKLNHSQGIEKADLLNSLSEEYWWFPHPIADSIYFYANRANLESSRIHYVNGVAISTLSLGVSEIYRRNYPKAEKYIRESIPKLETSHDDRSLAWCYLYLGQILYFKTEFSNADTAYEKASLLLRKVNGNEGAGRLCAYKSVLYTAMGEYGKGFEYCRKSLDIREKMNDHMCVLFSYKNFGNLYKAAGDYETALSYYYQSLQYARDHNLEWDENEQLGSIFCNLKKYDSSFYYLFQALRKYPQNPDLWLGLSETYLAGKAYDSSFKISLILMNKYRTFNDKVHLMTALTDAGKALEGKHNNQSALAYASEGLSLAILANAKPVMVDGYQLVAKIYSNLGKADSAYSYLNKYSLLRDSVLTNKFLSRLNYYENEAREEKKQAQLDLLDKDNRIEKARIGQQSLINAILIGSLFTIILLSIIVFRNILLRRKNEKLENKRQLAELQQKASELRMQSLRAQMNPHFIFNSLNSINRFILQSDKSQASEYLTKFSRLVRLILQNSQIALVPLAMEIETLQLYLELEVVRFNHRFEYQIDVDKNIELDFIKVPPLMMQPYVENAIWHGLMHKVDKGQLYIQVYPENGCLFLVIRDNGIGRKQASLFSGKSSSRHLSMGLKITAERIDLLQQSEDRKSEVVINDLMNADGSSGGTEVVVKIPSIYD
jgi:tetratricopeptide (TPR) repeat protein